MARIRSIHPSLWTDDDFVSLSAFARLMLIGVWNEADDYGLLPWKPTRLKMRIFPADDVDPRALMEELRRARFIVEITRGDQPYCVVKNFRKFQRPQRPSQPIIPIDKEIARIIGFENIDEYPDPPRALHEPSVNRATDGMVVGDRNGVSDANASGAAAPKPPQSLGEQIWALGPPYLEAHGCKKPRGIIGGWRKEHGDEPTLAALIAAERECVSEPVAWIVARLKNGGRQQKSGKSAGEERFGDFMSNAALSAKLCGDGRTVHADAEGGAGDDRRSATVVALAASRGVTGYG